MFCLMNFSLDIRNFHPFPCLFLFVCLFFAQITFQQNFKNLVAWSYKSLTAFFFFFSGIHCEKKTPGVCLFVDVFLFSLLHRKQRKMTGQFKGIVRASKRGAATARQNKKHKKKK